MGYAVALVSFVQFLSQYLYVGLQLCEQLLLCDAADALVVGVEGELLQVVQLAEHGELREFGNTGQEDETQILRLGLQRREETAHAVADILLQFGVVHRVEHRRIVFVHKHYHFLARLVVGGLYQAGQPCIVVHGVFAFTQSPHSLLLLEYSVESAVHALLLIIFAVGEVEADYGILLPFLLHVVDGQTLEELLAPLEVAAQRVHQQRLAEATRTA